VLGSSSSIRDNDRGYKRIVGMLKKYARQRTKIDVGWTGKHPSGINLADLGIIHEYGAPSANIPARPTLGPVFDAHVQEYKRLDREVWGRAIDGKEALARGLVRFATKMRSDVVKRINSGPYVPNAPATIARKGSSKPLIDTKYFRDHVEARITSADRTVRIGAT